MEKNIFDRKKVLKKKLVVGSGAGFGTAIPQNGSEDPDQNETDPKHWLQPLHNNPDLKGKGATDLTEESGERVDDVVRYNPLGVDRVLVTFQI